MKIIGDGFDNYDHDAIEAIMDDKAPLSHEYGNGFIVGFKAGHKRAIEHLRDAIRLARAVETLVSDDRWVTLAGKGVIVRAGKDCKPEGLIYAKPTLLDALERAAAAVNEGGAT